MKYLPGPHQTIQNHYKEILAFLKKELEKHQEDLNPEDPRDFIDAYLSEIEKVAKFMNYFNYIHLY